MEIDKDLPFETLLKLEEKLGSKTFREVHVKGSKTLLPKKRNTRQNSDEAPEEVSSKNPPKRAHIKIPKTLRPAPAIDPRFNPRAGKFKEEHFRKNFKFAFDLKEEELAMLKKQQTSSNPEEKEKAKYLVQRMENQKREQLKKQQNKAKMIINKDGSKYFPSKKEILAKELVEQYKDLKDSGKLQTHLEKRRKKQAGKERKKMQIEKS